MAPDIVDLRSGGVDAIGCRLLRYAARAVLPCSMATNDNDSQFSHWLGSR